MSQLINHSTGEVITGVDVTKTSLSLPVNISFDEWLEVGQQLDEIDTGISWWRGDWWRTQPAYGDRVKDAAESKTAWQTYHNCGSVAKSFADETGNASRRREGLPFSHHVEVCGLAGEKSLLH